MTAVSVSDLDEEAQPNTGIRSQRMQTQMTIFLPEREGYEFITLFGRKFATKDDDGEVTPRQVDGSVIKGGCMDITVTLEESEMITFNTTLNGFVLLHNLTLKE